VSNDVLNVEARAKHVLIRFSSGVTLHTHMQMSGAWYVYPAGARWRLPAWQARIVLESSDRVAVCFNAPVVELLRTKDELAHPVLGALGPDILLDPLDVDAIAARAAARPETIEIGDLLLDQRVVSGIGNIFRCEALFLAGVRPNRPRSGLDQAALVEAVLIAAKLMRANVRPGTSVHRDTGLGAGGRWVYGRAGQPCRRCGATIRSARVGGYARTAYWCPDCQQ
jgi:endonuclease-8